MADFKLSALGGVLGFGVGGAQGSVLGSIFGSSGGSTTDERRANFERGNAIVAAQMEEWRANGRTGEPPHLALLTKEDGEAIQKFNDFQGKQKLRDSSVLGSSNFNSILSPQRKTVGKPVETQNSVGPGGTDPNAASKFKDSVLQGKKRSRSILG